MDKRRCGVSFDLPEYTGDITGLGTVRLLEAIRRSGLRCHLYQASSSEMFGDAPAPQGEQTPFRPRSPYAAAKLYAYWMVRSYREGYGLFAANGIMFNHESPRRGETFVSRKITRAVAGILAGAWPAPRGPRWRGSSRARPASRSRAHPSAWGVEEVALGSCP